MNELLSSFFVLDEDADVWKTDGTGISVDDQQVDFANIRAYAKQTRDTIMKAFNAYLYGDNITITPDVIFGRSTHVVWPLWVNIINEVMRGAPVEHIDKEKEGLNTYSTIGTADIVAASKLERLIDSLKGTMSNTLLSIPDFSTMEHTEYLVAFLFKLMLVAITVVILYQIYIDAAAGRLGLKTILKSAWAVGLTYTCICIIPVLFQLTYYGANKMFLQKEATRICMYNLEKAQSGVEVGITETRIPDTHNKLMVQLDWVDVPWYLEIRELLFGESLKAVDVAREYAKRGSPLTLNPDVIFYNDGVYMDVEDIFDSVGMDYTFGENDASLNANGQMTDGLYLYANNNYQSLGFYSPYYAFLTALTANVNMYNMQHNCYMYTTKMQSGNRLKTVGLCSSYFQSEAFMYDDVDILHLYDLYDLPKADWYDNGVVFTIDDLMNMKKSAWYTDQLKEKDLRKRLDMVNMACRDFVASNRELLDKVTDETFIKVMSLYVAMQYNKIFGIQEASCLEIYNMDSNDLLRLSMSSADEAMLMSPLSYARYVLTSGGEAAVYAAAVLVMVMYLGSFIKPLCIIIAYVSVFLSVFVFHVVLRKKNNSLLGYCVTILLLGATNFLHAIVLKVSVYLPSIGLSTLGCLIAIIIFQVVYLMFLGYVTGHALRYWQDLGAAKYMQTAETVVNKVTGKRDMTKLNSNVPRYEDNWDYYNTLVRQHRERNTSI